MFLDYCAGQWALFNVSSVACMDVVILVSLNFFRSVHLMAFFCFYFLVCCVVHIGVLMFLVIRPDLFCDIFCIYNRVIAQKMII